MRKKIVILDRDGVINVDSKDYVRNPEDWIPIEGSLEAIATLGQKGYSVFVATNQSGIARGLLDRKKLEAIHAKMKSSVKSAGGKIEGVVYCPHGASDRCDCRKPRAGLLKQIESLAGESVKGCPFIGDSLRDIEAAQAGGCKPILVLTGNGLKTKTALRSEVVTYNDLSHFALSLNV